MEELLSQWEEIKNYIKQDRGMLDLAYEKKWVRHLKLLGVKDNTCTIGVPDSVDMEGLRFIESKYGSHLKASIENVTGNKYDIKFVKGDNASKDPEGISDYQNKANLNPRYTFDNFVVGKSNSFARAAAMAVAEGPGNKYNPLFIWGGSGNGKTHLLHAIGHEVLKRNPKMNLLYVSADSFTSEVIDAIRSGDQTVMSQFRDKYRNLDLLLLDDVQFLEGKECTQEELFCILNELHASGKAIVLSSDKPLNCLTAIEERMKNRFGWGIAVDIGAPDYETRVSILRKHVELNYNDINLSDDILQYLATKVHSNVMALECALNNLVFYHRMKKEKIMTIETVDEAVRSIISFDDKREITMPAIMNAVCDYFDIEESEILSGQRDPKISDIRMIIMYLCYEMTDLSMAEIGKALNRNYANVIHGIDKVKENMENDESFFDQMTELKKIIDNG